MRVRTIDVNVRVLLVAFSEWVVVVVFSAIVTLVLVTQHLVISSTSHLSNAVLDQYSALIPSASAFMNFMFSWWRGRVEGNSLATMR